MNRSRVTTLAELVGLALITAGVWTVAMPAGLITAGIACVLVGVFQS